jgi:hypothetical protein
MHFVSSAILIFSLALLVGCGAPSAAPLEVTVYKSPTCGCCGKWVTYLEENGFSVVTHEVKDVAPIKRLHGVPEQLGSCHTALIGDYVIEGHVPVADIHRLLDEAPKVKGIAVPGMPIGSPGMEGPNPEAYRVIAFAETGGTEDFASHGPEEARPYVR